MCGLSLSALMCAQGEDYRVPTRNDQHDFREVQQGLSTLGFTDQEAAVSVSCSPSALYVRMLLHMYICMCMYVHICIHQYVSVVIVHVYLCV